MEENPFEKRSCYDCKHLKGYVSWWCTNEDAIKARGTRIPGCIHCPFWKPDWSMIDAKYKETVFDRIRKRTKLKTKIKVWLQIQYLILINKIKSL